MIQKVIGGLAFCIALLVGTVYGIHYFWWWLNDAKDVAGVQAATAIIVGVPATFFAVFATIASIQSAEASMRQAEAAKTQTELMRAQLREQERPTFAVERLFPHLDWTDENQTYELRNIGPGAAFGLRLKFMKNGEEVGWHKGPHMDFIPPHAATLVLADKEEFDRIWLYYQSSQKELYEILVIIMQTGPIISYVDSPDHVPTGKTFICKAEQDLELEDTAGESMQN